jgi:hypothetical protein
MIRDRFSFVVMGLNSSQSRNQDPCSYRDATTMEYGVRSIVVVVVVVVVVVRTHTEDKTAARRSRLFVGGVRQLYKMRPGGSCRSNRSAKRSPGLDVGKYPAQKVGMDGLRRWRRVVCLGLLLLPAYGVVPCTCHTAFVAPKGWRRPSQRINVAESQLLRRDWGG